MNSATKLNLIIGNPVSQSLSPKIHNFAYHILGLQDKFAFLATRVLPENLEKAILGIKALEINGLSVTIPHKVEVLELLDEVEETAAKIGSVNTIINHNGNLIGYNTDWLGTLCPLQILITKNANILSQKSLFNQPADLVEKLHPAFKSESIISIETAVNLNSNSENPQGFFSTSGQIEQFLSGFKVAVIGAGGAARAMVFALLFAGAEVKIFNRTLEKAERIAEDMQKIGFSKISSARLDWLYEVKNYQIIVNSTDIGMKEKKNLTPVPVEFLHSEQIIFDAVYDPEKTIFMRQAREKGAKTIGGIEMLLWQAVFQFKLQTGKDVEYEILKRGLTEGFYMYSLL